MSVAWWFESLWRGAIVALAGFALLAAYLKAVRHQETGEQA